MDSLASSKALAPTPAPTDPRGLVFAITVLAAVIFVMRYAGELMLPIVLALLISYAFDPIVKWLGRRKLPRALGAALVLAVFVASVGYGVYSLRDDALEIVEALPASAKKLGKTVRAMRGEEGPVQALTEAVVEIEKATEAAAAPPPVPPGVTRVQVEEKPFDVTQYLWLGSVGVLGFATQAVLILFLVYFLLASGDLFRRKLVKLAGPTLSRQRVTVQILDEITAQIERFLLVQMFTSVLVAVASSLALYALGLERALFWGILAGLLNTIPYFGPLIVMGGVAALALLQFGSVDRALVAAGLSLTITSLEGFLLTPYLLGKRLRMNGVAVFVGLLFWGWMWGAWGMLLAMPIMVVIKSVCDHVEDLRGVGEMLGE